MTRWLDPQPIQVPASFEDLKLPPLIARTLVRRGITSADSARAFLHPQALPSTPFPGIENAVDRILLAARKHEKICVWGDFDVDGQTSTTLLVQTLQAVGADVIYYIPIRGKESHGVHIESLKPIIDGGISLIVTCDTGITAYEAIEYANSRGVDVVITDHHDLGETLPNAKAILNPKLLAKDHPLANLAGVGVAYKLAEALTENQSLQPNVLLDLVALGLIADVALLKGETRALAQKGILALRETNRLGLKVMAELSGTNLETLTEETIGFTFAPRLNALGRLSDANPAVEFLLTQNAGRARVLAAQIEGLNAQRKLLTSQVYQAAESQLRENSNILTEPAIVLSHLDWPGGVVGIVANKLVERYHKPAFLLCEAEDGILRGSARSIEGLHITEAIAANKEFLLGFGGHPMAAGLSLKKENLAGFQKGLNRSVEKQFGEIVAEEPALQIDAWLSIQEISPELAETLESLAPFGAGNPQLILAARNVTLKSVKEIGKTKEHRRLIVADEAGSEQDLLWWNGAGEELPEEGSLLDVAFTLRAGAYRGQKQLTLQFKEYRVVQEPAVEIKKPKFAVIDLRLQAGKFKSLNAQIFAEGEQKKQTNGTDRFHLSPADEVTIYTPPPGPAELRALMSRVHPNKVYLAASALEEEKPEVFLTRLAGLARFALNRRGGKTTIQELAAAMSAREAAIQIGLEWLKAGGHLKVEVEADDVTLEAGDSESNPYLQKELYIALKGVLAETAAYRAHFARAEAESLFKI